MEAKRYSIQTPLIEAMLNKESYLRNFIGY